jgi:hypothetical protein
MHVIRVRWYKHKGGYELVEDCNKFSEFLNLHLCPRYCGTVVTNKVSAKNYIPGFIIHLESFGNPQEDGENTRTAVRNCIFEFLGPKVSDIRTSEDFFRKACGTLGLTTLWLKLMIPIQYIPVRLSIAEVYKRAEENSRRAMTMGFPKRAYELMQLIKGSVKIATDAATKLRDVCELAGGVDLPQVDEDAKALDRLKEFLVNLSLREGSLDRKVNDVFVRFGKIERSGRFGVVHKSDAEPLDDLVELQTAWCETSWCETYNMESDAENALETNPWVTKEVDNVIRRIIQAYLDLVRDIKSVETYITSREAKMHLIEAAVDRITIMAPSFLEKDLRGIADELERKALCHKAVLRFRRAKVEDRTIHCGIEGGHPDADHRVSVFNAIRATIDSRMPKPLSHYIEFSHEGEDLRCEADTTELLREADTTELLREADTTELLREADTTELLREADTTELLREARRVRHKQRKLQRAAGAAVADDAAAVADDAAVDAAAVADDSAP